MSETQKRSMTADSSNGIAKRAAWSLGRQYAGRHRDKRIASDLGCSVRMAQYLLEGVGWTMARFEQCAERFGLGFIRDVFAPRLSQRQLDDWLLDLERRMAALEGRDGAIGARLADGADGISGPIRGGPAGASSAAGRGGDDAAGVAPARTEGQSGCGVSQIQTSQREGQRGKRNDRETVG
jgi:hypothetical protein